MSGHFIKRCTYCGVVISQCRCPGPRKLRRGVCADCFKRRQDPQVANAMAPLTDAEIDASPRERSETP